MHNSSLKKQATMKRKADKRERVPKVPLPASTSTARPLRSPPEEEPRVSIAAKAHAWARGSGDIPGKGCHQADVSVPKMELGPSASPVRV